MNFYGISRMRRKELEQRLSSIKDFANPKVELEQYATRATIASDILYTAAHEYDDIEDALVVDLGAGAGALTAASLYVSAILPFAPKNLKIEKFTVQCGAGAVIGIEIDHDAILVNLENRENEDFDESIWEVVQGDIVQMAENGTGRFSKIADVVVTNPPFGTKSNEGIDMKFLEAAQDCFHKIIFCSIPSGSTTYEQNAKLTKANIEFSDLFSSQVKLSKWNRQKIEKDGSRW